MFEKENYKPNLKCTYHRSKAKYIIRILSRISEYLIDINDLIDILIGIIVKKCIRVNFQKSSGN